jgi:hypothetical protein
VRAAEAILERYVLDHDLRIRLVNAIMSGPCAGTSVGEEDPAFATAAKSHQTAAIQDDQVFSIRNSRSRGHQDRDRLFATVEPYDPAGGDGSDHGAGGTTSRRAIAY